MYLVGYRNMTYMYLYILSVHNNSGNAAAGIARGELAARLVSMVSFNVGHSSRWCCFHLDTRNHSRHWTLKSTVVRMGVIVCQ